MLLKRVNLVPKYPFKFSTFLMCYKSLASTVFWVCLAVCFHWDSAYLLCSTLFNLASEAFFNCDWVQVFCLLNQASSTLAFTPSTDTLVDVAMTYAGLTLFNGTPLTANGPVTKRFPDARDFNTTTLLPLCLPDKRMTTLPDWIDFLPVVGLGWFLFLWWSLVSSSAGYQVLALFLNLLFGAPPRAKIRW